MFLGKVDLMRKGVKSKLNIVDKIGFVNFSTVVVQVCSAKGILNNHCFAQTLKIEIVLGDLQLEHYEIPGACYANYRFAVF